MKSRFCLIALIFLISSYNTNCQEKTHAISFNVSVAEEIRSSFNPNGRLFIFMGTNPNAEPRLQIDWPHNISGEHFIFAKNFSAWKPNQVLTINSSSDWSKWARMKECDFRNIPSGTYYIQLLWDQNFDGSGINTTGNIHSKKQEVKLTSSQSLDIFLTETIEPVKLIDHKLVKYVKYKSDTLSKWWKRPVYEQASVLLPSGYYNIPGKAYPIRYHIGGGFSPYYRINNLMTDTVFYKWWISDKAPQIITIFLDGELNGNIYHIDSDNFGPFGYSLINEFIPYVENLYRGTDTPDTRFTDGCSTGGYGSLALQLFYPETFNGVFSYSPDPTSFARFFTANIYVDKNIFYNPFGYERMAVRTLRDEPVLSIKDWVQTENVLGHSGTYIDSDHIFGIWTSLFGPKGDDRKPVPLFNPETGDIDSDITKSWSRYDLSKYIEENWKSIGFKLKGKIYIWVGTADIAYFNNPVWVFESTISKLENPKPDAIIEFTPNCGHCEKYSHRRVLEQIAEKIDKMKVK